MLCYHRFALGASVLLFSCVAWATPPGSLGRFQQALQNVRHALAQGDVAAARSIAAELDRELEHGKQQENHESRLRKLHAIAALAQELANASPTDNGGRAQRAADSDSDSETSLPMLLIDSDEATGARCRSAMTLPSSGESVKIALDGQGGAHAEAWLRWRAPAAGQYAISSRGDRTDPTLTVYRDCADTQALEEDDDTFGLDAQVVVTTEYAGQVLHLKAGNVAENGGEVVIATSSTTTISGRVVSEIDGQPLTNVYMRVYRVDGSYFNYAGSAYTDNNGAYSIGVWGEGNFLVRTASFFGDHEEFLHEVWDDVPCQNPDGYYNLSFCGDGTLIPVTVGNPVTGIDFALGPGIDLIGRVLDSRTGLPVAGATIEVSNGQLELREVTTDAAGRYQARALGPGTVYVKASAPEYTTQLFTGVECPDSCNFSEGTAVELSESQPPRADFSLVPSAYIDVDLTVEGDPGSVFSYPSIDLFHPNGAPVLTQVWNRGLGKFRVGPLQPGSYRLRAYSPGAHAQLYAGVDCETNCTNEQDRATLIVIADRGDRPHVSMDLRPLPGLHGRIIDAASGEPIANARVSFRRQEGTTAYDGSVVSDANGEYNVTSLWSGSYVVFVDAPRFIDQLYPAQECESAVSPPTCTAMQTVSFGLSTGDRTANFELRRAPRVTGRFLNDNQPITTGLDAWSSSVQLRHPATLAPPSGTSLSLDAETGSYILSDYPEGTYFISSEIYGYFRQVANGLNCQVDLDWPAACPWSDARSHLLGAGDVVVDFNLVSRGRKVRVRNAAGQALAGIAIDQWNVDGQRVGTAVTGADGRVFLHADNYYPFSVRLSTDNYAGYTDQVYKDIACPSDSSVFRGGCGLAGATSITLPSDDPQAPEIIFTLAADGDVFVFGDSFE